MSRPVGGILSERLAGAWVAIHLSGLPGDCTRRCGRAPDPTLGLAPGGVCRAARVTPDAGALLPHRFTLTCDRPGCPDGPSAVCSLWHFPAGRPDWPLASTLPCGVPTFLDTVTCSCRDHPADSPSPTSVPAPLATWRPRYSRARGSECPAGSGAVRREGQTYDAVPTARVTLPNGDGNSSSSGSTAAEDDRVAALEWPPPTGWSGAARASRTAAPTPGSCRPRCPRARGRG